MNLKCSDFAQTPNADVFVPDVGVKRTSEEKQASLVGAFPERPGETSAPLNMERKIHQYNNGSVDPPSLAVLLISGVIEQIRQNKNKNFEPLHPHDSSTGEVTASHLHQVKPEQTSDVSFLAEPPQDLDPQMRTKTRPR